MKEWRRKYSRIKCYNPPAQVMPILLHFGSERHADGWGVIQDISLGGIGVETRSPVRKGQTVYVTFSIADNFTFASAKAVIRRVIDGKLYRVCGIEFESLVDRQHLEEALAALAENEEKEKKA